MGTTTYRETERRLWDSVGLEPSDELLRLGRLQTSVRIQEIGDGPVVLFVHGGSSSGANWAPLLPFLRGFRCVVLDRPGCGLSLPIDDDLTDLDRFAEVADELVADVLDAMRVDHGHVVATSLGACFALRSAAAHPDRIDRLVTFGYVVGAPMERLPLAMRIATVPGVGRIMTSLPPTRGAVRAILRQLGLGPALDDGRVSVEMIEWFRSLLRDTATMRNELNSPRQLISTRQVDAGVLPVEVLGAIECPVRLVWGAQDPLGGAETASAFANRIERATLELWDLASHAPWIDDPERAAASVRAFLG